jgi:hypothetical protein
MRNYLTAVGVVVALALPVAAHAQEGGEISHRKFGVGVERSLTGLSAAALVFETGKLHFDALLGFALIQDGGGGNDDETRFAVGGRVWYAIAQSTRADFNVGGGFLVDSSSIDDGNGNNDDTDVNLEGGAQIRAFLVPNVAFTGEVGLAIAVDDDAGQNPLIGNSNGYTALLGFAGAFGLAYFF